MDNNIVSYNIQFNDTLTKELLKNSIFSIDNQSYLLYSSKEEFNLLEKMIYDLAIFHIEMQNINLDNNIFIEFKLEKKIYSQLDFDYDKYNKILNKNSDFVSPIVTTITYLDNVEIPDIFTDVDIEKYKFKDFINQNKLCLSFPTFLKHISFNGGNYYYGTSNILQLENKERTVLKVNIWNKHPLNIPYYMNNLEPNDKLFDKSHKLLYLIENEHFKKIELTEDILNEEFFEKIIYNSELNDYNKFVNYIKDDYNKYDFFILENNVKKQEVNVIDKLVDNSHNKFLQRFIHKNFYNEFICNYIMNESMKLLENKDNFINYNDFTVISIENIPNIINLIMNSFQNIIDKIIKNYCLKDKKKYNIKDVFILKNNSTSINKLYHDNSSVSINIVLNSKFEGGNLVFDDELEYEIEQGDLFIYSGKRDHSYLPTNNGIQYILVGLIDICE